MPGRRMHQTCDAKRRNRIGGRGEKACRNAPSRHSRRRTMRRSNLGRAPRHMRDTASHRIAMTHLGARRPAASVGAGGVRFRAQDPARRDHDRRGDQENRNPPSHPSKSLFAVQASRNRRNHPHSRIFVRKAPAPLLFVCQVGYEFAEKPPQVRDNDGFFAQPEI